MGRLKILAQGRSSQARTRSRDKLLEAMMIQVLHHYGYSTDRILDAGAAEMEIDIEGRYRATGSPLFADCKFYETAVSASKLHAFYGKYMTRWHKDKRCHGLFIALPGIDRSAREFYQEHIEGNPHVTARLYEEDQVLKAISRNPGSVGPDIAAKQIPQHMGKPGKFFLLYTEKGVKISVARYKNGEKHGKWKIRNDEGNLLYELQYKNGEKTGTWKSYNEQGKLIKKREY